MEFVKEILMFPFRSPTSDSCFVYIALGTKYNLNYYNYLFL